jgi:hypothetical protein
MTRPALVANLLTLLAFPIPSAAAPAVPAVVPQHGDGETPNPEAVVRVRSQSPEIGLVSLQVLAGYAVGIGGMAGLIEAGVYPKQLGIRSDMANLAYVALLAPALASAAVCGTGYLSSRYNGRCATTLLGAYTGAAVGVVLGFLMAPAPGPDDSADFSKAMAAIAGAALLTPIGAVAGWHIGKQEIAQPAMVGAQPAMAGAQPAMLASLPSARSLMLPVLNLRW